MRPSQERGLTSGCRKSGSHFREVRKAKMRVAGQTGQPSNAAASKSMKTDRKSLKLEFYGDLCLPKNDDKVDGGSGFLAGSFVRHPL